MAEAVGSALELWKRQVDAAASGGPPVPYGSLIDEYLSAAHRNHPGTGCLVASLAGDRARTDRRTRALVGRKVRDNIELLATLIRNKNKTDSGSARAQAILTYCALVGAISMARAVSDQELSREILKTATQHLNNLAAKSHITIRAAKPEANEILIQVTDSSAGVEDPERIFDALVITKKTGGLGTLGLYRGR